MTESSPALRPTNVELQEAKNWPNGYVYRVDPAYDPDGEVPACAIEGAWPVDAQGDISGEFLPNPDYQKSDQSLQWTVLAHAVRG